jgi:hypothetical protein
MDRKNRSDTITDQYKSFENFTTFNLGTTVTNKSCVHEEIKSIFSFGHACYRAVQNFCVPVCCIKMYIEITRSSRKN